jgi:hypothetical protein
MYAAFWKNSRLELLAGLASALRSDLSVAINRFLATCIATSACIGGCLVQPFSIFVEFASGNPLPIQLTYKLNLIE